MGEGRRRETSQEATKIIQLRGGLDEGGGSGGDEK